MNLGLSDIYLLLILCDTGSSFYITKIICYLVPLLVRCVSGLPEYDKRAEYLAIDICQIK